MAVANQDSTEKINSYLKSSSLDRLILSKLLFRDNSCQSHCGACCPKFSLDYFEGHRWEKFKKEYPHKVKNFTAREVNGLTVYSDKQEDNDDRYCKHLNQEDGRCGIHESNPLTCEFELMRFVTREKEGVSYLMNKLFGRGWNMTKINGEKGAMCEMLDFNYDKLLRDISMLKELNDIAIGWKIKTKLPQVIEYLETNLPSFKQGILPKSNIVFDDNEKIDLFTNN